MNTARLRSHTSISAWLLVATLLGASACDNPAPFEKAETDTTAEAAEQAVAHAKSTRGAPAAAAQDIAAIHARARAILEKKCASCHFDGADEPGPFGSILSEAVQRRKLVKPGSPEDSLLYKSVLNDVMPKVGGPLSAEEKNTLRDWIKTYDAPPATAPTKTSETQLRQAILEDLRALPESDRRLSRYFRFDNLSNADASTDRLSVHREALAKVLNSLSFKKEIYLPETLGRGDRLVRIDLRKLGWSVKTWEEIQQADPFKAAADEKTEAAKEEARKLTGSDDPVARAQWFIATAVRPPLYYSILGIPKEIKTLEKQLGVDTRRSLEEHSVVRSGFLSSGVSQSNRIIERYDSSFGAYWKSLDYSDNNDVHDIFAHPLDSKPAGGEVIFNLPNGFQAYVLLNDSGTRLDKAPVAIVKDAKRPDSAVENAISCFRCHATGMIYKEDEIRASVERHTKDFAQKDLETIRGTHLDPVRLQGAVNADTQTYRDALGKISARAAQEDILTPIIEDFEDNVDLATAAAELGTTTDTLAKALADDSQAVPGFASLIAGANAVTRETYASGFTAASGLIQTPGAVAGSNVAGKWSGSVSFTNTDTVLGISVNLTQKATRITGSMIWSDGDSCGISGTVKGRKVVFSCVGALTPNGGTFTMVFASSVQGSGSDAKMQGGVTSGSFFLKRK